MVRRLHQIVALISLAGIAWLLMQAVHEAGHVLGAWLTGGTVQRVVLHPLAISRTDVEPNPHPLLVAWAGPIFGAAVPLLGWTVARALRIQWAWLVQLFAGFCLLANGLYLGVGSFGGVGDAGDIVARGSPIWALWLFGLVTAPAGLILWNGMGRKLGLGTEAEEVDAVLAYGSLVALVAIVVALLVAAHLSGNPS